ncbi:hypothetical protein GVAV_000262 [Gurleya vavrai]
MDTYIKCTQDNKDSFFTPKKIANEFLKIAMEQYFEDKITIGDSENYECMIIFYENNIESTCNFVEDLVYNLQKKFFEGQFSMLNTSVNPHYKKNLLIDYFSYPLKAFFLCNELAKSKGKKSFSFQETLKCEFKSKININEKIDDFVQFGFTNHVRIFQNYDMSTETLFYFYKNVQKFFENLRNIGINQSLVYMFFKKNLIENVKEEINSFYKSDFKYMNDDRYLYSYSFVPLVPLDVHDLDNKYFENFDSKQNSTQFYDRLKENDVLIENIAYTLHIPQLWRCETLDNLQNWVISNSYIINFKINCQNFMLVCFSYQTKENKILQTELKYKKIKTVLYLKQYNEPKIISTCFRIVIKKSKLYENVSNNIKQEIKLSLNSQEEMRSKIAQFKKMINFQNFKIDKEFILNEEFFGFNNSLVEISLFFNKDFVLTYPIDSMFSFFVSRISNLSYKTELAIDFSFYTYEADNDFFELLNIDYCTIYLENLYSQIYLLKMKKITIEAAKIFRETCKNNLVAVIEVKLQNQSQKYLIFPNSFKQYEFNSEAFEFYNTNKLDLFEEFFKSNQEYLKDFLMYDIELYKKFFKYIFINLTQCELKNIFLDHNFYKHNRTFIQIIYLRMVFNYYTILRKNSEDKGKLDLIDKDILKLLQCLEKNESIDEMDITEYDIFALKIRESIFNRFLFNMFDFLRFKILEFYENRKIKISKKFKIISKGKYFVDNKCLTIIDNLVGID